MRDTMIEGETGVLTLAPKRFRPKYEPSKRRLTWPNGSVATAFSSKEPDHLRGPQHHLALCDEVASWFNPDGTWSNLMFGLRLGEQPRVCVTTTPRPIKLLKILRRAGTTRVVYGSSMENRANLTDAYFSEVIAPYLGTRLGRQEVEGELLEDTPGALWTWEMIEKARWRADAKLPTMFRVVTAVDPATTAGEDSDETGIIVAAKGHDGRGYVMGDLSGKFSPKTWADRVIATKYGYGTDRIVAETNNGGDLVESNLRAQKGGDKIPYKSIHAKRNKEARAEPIAALFEQGLISFVGDMKELEDQLTGWVPGQGSSPDRLDAMVYALTELMLDGGRARHISGGGGRDLAGNESGRTFLPSGGRVFQ